MFIKIEILGNAPKVDIIIVGPKHGEPPLIFWSKFKGYSRESLFIIPVGNNL